LQFFNIQDGSVRHLGFSKFPIFTIFLGREGQYASLSQISSKSSGCGDMAFIVFKMVVVHLFAFSKI